MTEKYLQMNNEVFVFNPDTFEVARIASKHPQRLHHPDELRRLRVTAVEITRQQAECFIRGLRLGKSNSRKKYYSR